MLTDEEMIGLQAERHSLINPDKFSSEEEYVLHLIHKKAYAQTTRIVENKKVLDLGCNTGYGTAMLIKSAKEVIGVDVSEKAIANASILYGNLGIKFILIDGKTLPFKDKTFDVVTCFQVIEHIVDYQNFIYEIKRILTDQGMVFFTTPNAMIRLNPGMKPWNVFHVKEFDYRDLKILLDSFFKGVDIFGLFADEPLYSIEAQRVARIRSSFERVSIHSLVRKLFPEFIRNYIRLFIRGFHHLKYKTGLKTQLDKYGTNDFFYKQDVLEAALDLLAVCSDNEKDVVTIKFKLLGNEKNDYL